MRPFFFDVDGTLINSEDGIINSLIYAQERLGRPIPPIDTLKLFIGPPLADSYRDILHYSPAEVQQGIKFYREKYKAGAMFEGEVYPGIPEVLQKLKENGQKLFIATSKPHNFALQVLDHFQLSGYFDAVYGATSENKTKTQVIHAALAHAKQEQTGVMVGDRKFDMIGATYNGLIGVGVSYGFGSRAELADAGADFIIDAPEELLALFD